MSAPRHPSDVYLLGAGFARAISPEMPLLQDLAARVVEALAANVRLPPEVRAMMEENFAHALSYLEQAKPWLTEADNLRHRALFLDMSNAIASVLEATVATVSPSLSSSAPPWLGALIRHWHEQRCTVLTLNYDTLIEVAAAGVRVEGERSIAPRDLYPTLLTDASARTGDHSSSERHESFRLLKLHGSTNWYYSGRTAAAGETIYFVPPLRPGSADEAARRRHEHLIRAVADKYPFMVPPIYDKSPLLTHETIRALWFDAGEALRSARRIICMGYSLPSSDLTMMHFLRTNCGESARIEIVNESRAAAENFHRLFARTKVQVDVAGSGETCVPAFLEHHLRRRR